MKLLWRVVGSESYLVIVGDMNDNNVFLKQFWQGFYYFGFFIVLLNLIYFLFWKVLVQVRIQICSYQLRILYYFVLLSLEGEGRKRGEIIGFVEIKVWRIFLSLLLLFKKRKTIEKLNLSWFFYKIYLFCIGQVLLFN